MSAAHRRSLASAIDADDTEAVINVARAVLATMPDDTPALIALTVALCKDQQFEEALKVSDAHTDTDAVHFARSYALYKLKRLTDQSLPSQSTAATFHLRAQHFYRLAKFDQATKIYQEKFQAADIDCDAELAANVLAATIGAGDSAGAGAIIDRLGLRKSPSSYELSFNAACALIDSGDIDAALASLITAHSLARPALETEGLSDEEMARELAVIKCQEAYVRQLKRDNGAAIALYNDILHTRDLDPAVAAVASNNLLAVHGSDSKVFDSLKRSKKAEQIRSLDEEKLLPKQKSILAFNRIIALIAAKKYSEAKQQCDAVSDSDMELATLVRAALVAADKSGDARAILSSSTGIECRLALAQLALNGGDVSEARSLLSSINATEDDLRRVAAVTDTNNTVSFQHRPSVAGALAALDERLNEGTSAAKRIDGAVRSWSEVAKKSDSARRVYMSLLEHVADWHLAHHRTDEAAAVLKLIASVGQLSQSGAKVVDSSQVTSLARLVVATAQVDTAAAEGLASRLPQPFDLSGIDVTALESQVVPELTKRKKPTDGEKNDSDKASKAKAKKKRKRAPRYPKGFDPANPTAFPAPDPQRWLPKWERTNVKSKKKAKNPLRGAQGAGDTKNITMGASVQSSTTAALADKQPSAPAAASQPAPQSAAAKKSAAKRKGKKGK